MKILVLASIFLICHSITFAQTETLSPKWKKGDFWKITCTAKSNNEDDIENVTKHNLSKSEMFWEILDVTDSTAKFSILPISLVIEEENYESTILRNGVNTLIQNNTPLIYVTHANGSFFKIGLDLNDSSRFFINDSIFRQQILSKHSYSNLGSEVSGSSEELSYEFNLTLTFYYKILENIHANFGLPIQNHPISHIGDIHNATITSYFNELANLRDNVNIQGHQKVLRKEDEMTKDVLVGVDMKEALYKLTKKLLENTKNKSQKNKLKKELMDIQNSTLYIEFVNVSKFDANDYTPKSVSFKVSLQGSTKGEKINISTENMITFER